MDRGASRPACSICGTNLRYFSLATIIGLWLRIVIRQLWRMIYIYIYIRLALRTYSGACQKWWWWWWWWWWLICRANPRTSHRAVSLSEQWEPMHLNILWSRLSVKVIEWEPVQTTLEPPANRGRGGTKLKGLQVLVSELFIYTYSSAVVFLLHRWSR